uniref:Uncharacterized protein n=1 Tax=Arundo donax TaxID=35708 RepID=A0A0A8YB14_ARUDO
MERLDASAMICKPGVPLD